jgi:hypothetical protein
MIVIGHNILFFLNLLICDFLRTEYDLFQIYVKA